MSEHSVETEATTVLIGGGRYEPPGNADTFRAAKAAMWEDQVEGHDPDEIGWDFWIRLAVLMSDLAGAYESQVTNGLHESAVYYDQEMHVALGYLKMTGRDS